MVMEMKEIHFFPRIVLRFYCICNEQEGSCLINKIFIPTRSFLLNRFRIYIIIVEKKLITVTEISLCSSSGHNVRFT